MIESLGGIDAIAISHPHFPQLGHVGRVSHPSLQPGGVLPHSTQRPHCRFSSSCRGR